MSYNLADEKELSEEKPGTGLKWLLPLLLLVLLSAAAWYLMGVNTIAPEPSVVTETSTKSETPAAAKESVVEKVDTSGNQNKK